jgi:hypothetical protein
MQQLGDGPEITAESAAGAASGPNGHDELPRGAVAWAGRPDAAGRRHADRRRDGAGRRTIKTLSMSGP